MKVQRVIFLSFVLLYSLSDLSLSQSNPADAVTGKRLALVIGNGKYINSMELANPVNDARAMKRALQDVGFDVYEYEDLNQSQMKMAIDKFGSLLKQYSVGLFFYAGHGIQSRGANYLIPVDASLQSEQQVEYDCVQADRVLGFMEAAGSRINIVILDACRNNPFERSWSRAVNGTGLAFMNAPTGSLIAYATSPGRTASDGSGSNGLYTSALLENIKTPGISILQMFQKVRQTVASKSGKQQIPWESTSLTADFFFVGEQTTTSSGSDISNTETTLNNLNSVRTESAPSNKNVSSVTWKRDEKSFWVFLNGQDIAGRLIGTWSDSNWLVYDPVSNNTYLLEDFYNKPVDQELDARLLGNASDAWWRLDSKFYYLFVKGENIGPRTKRFVVDNDLVVYDEITNTTYLLKNYTSSADNQFRPAIMFDNSESAFWRQLNNNYWLYSKGEEIQFRTKCAMANNDLLVYDNQTNTTYLLQGYNVESNDTKLKPARVISYMDDILWMRTGNTYWLYMKGELISGRTTSYASGNDLIVTDNVDNVRYVLSDYFNTPDNQFKTAYKSQ
jgi:hypothetical protein